MSNYGMNMGEGNTYTGDTKITNKTVVKRGKVIVSLALVVIVIAGIFHITRGDVEEKILGKWVTDEGDSMEFISDGTVRRDGDGSRSMFPDVYEILDEGYLKIGEYDAGWIAYEYTYWEIEIRGNHMTLTRKENPEIQIELTRE